MIKNKRIISAIIISVIASTLLAGCGQSKPTATKAIKVNIFADPKTIDPGLNNSVEGSQVINNVFEGLTNTDNNEKIIPGVAEKWEVSKDGLTYTFHLRKNAKWSDGKPVTAKDFEYAWERALAPDTASEFAYQLYYLKNGKAFNQNKTTANELGVKATDDYTLIVTLENPTPYFLSLVSTGPYMPIRKDVIEKNSKDWTTKPETYVSNGAFKLKEYKPKDSINLEKNNNYWNSQSVKLDRVELKTLDNQVSYTAAFKTGQLDLIDKPSSELVKDGTAKTYPYLGTYYYYISLSSDAANITPEVSKALKDTRVRKALSLAINRKAITEKVTQNGEKPATTLVPSSVTIDGSKFKNKDYYKDTADVEEAKKLLADAGYSNGQGFPKLEFLYNTGQGHKNIAEAIQEMWRVNLGINIELRNVERKVQLTELKNHNYMISRGGWIADYNDPLAFLDLFTTNNPQNHSSYSNEKFDSLITAAKSEADMVKRLNELHNAEDLIINDLPIIPIYEYTEVVCMNKKLKNVHVSPLGFFQFRDSYIEN